MGQAALDLQFYFEMHFERGGTGKPGGTLGRPEGQELRAEPQKRWVGRWWDVEKCPKDGVQ